MPVKPYVLNGYYGVLKHIRNVLYVDPIPVFITGKSGYELAAFVVYIRCSVAFGQKRYIKLRRGVNIGLGYSQNKPHSRAAQKHHKKEHKLTGRKEYGEHERPLLPAFNKQLLLLP